MEKIKSYKEFLNEGMFDNGIKRAHTKDVRQEDDVNLMNPEEFTNYINDVYNFDPRGMGLNNAKYRINKKENLKNIQCDMGYHTYSNDSHYFLYFEYKENKNVKISFNIYDSKLNDLDKTKFGHGLEDPNDSWSTIIWPIKDKMDNKFCIDLLNAFTEIKEYDIIKR